MKYSLLAATQLLVPREGGTHSDTDTLYNVRASDMERLVEYAGRVCYASTAKMGTAPEFIMARMREEHLDITEHGWFVVLATPDDDMGFSIAELGLLDAHHPYINVECFGSEWALLSGNARAWWSWVGYNLNEFAAVRGAMTGIFAPMETHAWKSLGQQRGINERSLMVKVAPPPPLAWHYLTVVPLAMAYPNVDGRLTHRIDAMHRRKVLAGDDSDRAQIVRRVLDSSFSLTVLVDGISRACSHQLVRHRKLSFSQESQRYVDLAKGNWGAVIPPAVAALPLAEQRMMAFWAEAEQAYRDLRGMGVLREDARFLLPNAAQTRIVVSGGLEDWKYFLRQRLDKAAQWEIRGVAEGIYATLCALLPAGWDAAEPWAEQKKAEREKAEREKVAAEQV